MVCRGDEPRAGNGTRICFKNSGAHIAPQTSVRQAGSLDPAKPRKPARLADPARRVDSAPPTGARQLNPARPKPPQQASTTRGVLRNPAMGQLPSHPSRTMGRVSVPG